MKIVAIIPVRLDSKRFYRKALIDIHGFPMIEHVRRRALFCSALSDVIVATCDAEVADIVESFGGKVVMTSSCHRSGTSRIVEASKDLDATHIVLMQGDEPLLLPRHVEALITKMKDQPDVAAWNLVSRLEPTDLDEPSVVKCSVSRNNNILYCYRRSPHFSDFDSQNGFIRKVNGIMAFRKDFLMSYLTLPDSKIEAAEGIEQMRIIESGSPLISVDVEPSLPSINIPSDYDIVQALLKTDLEQKELLEKTLLRDNHAF